MLLGALRSGKVNVVDALPLFHGVGPLAAQLEIAMLHVREFIVLRMQTAQLAGGGVCRAEEARHCRLVPRIRAPRRQAQPRA